MREPARLVERLPHARRRLRVHQHDDLRTTRARDRGGEDVVGHDLAPWGVGLDHGGARARRDVDEARPEDAVHADHHLVAGLDEVHDARLEAGAAGARDRQRERVLGLEDAA